MQALILAGGEGTRLRPLTSTVPKPVVPLVDRPFAAYMLEWLRGHGVDDVVMSCGHGADTVREVLGDGSSLGVRLRYVAEPRPLGTGGAIKYAEAELDERFLVLNGDVLTDVDLAAQLAHHEATGARATIALIEVEDPSAYGLVRLAGDGAVREFLEKPSPDQIDSRLVNAGIYVLEREVLSLLAPDTTISIERDVFPALIGQGLHGYPVQGYWLDIGTPERYLRATFDILARTVRTVVGERLGDDFLAVAGDVRNAGRIVPPGLVERGVRVGAGARIGSNAVLGRDVVVGEGTVIERSVVLERSHVGAHCTLNGCIVGPACRIGDRTHLQGETVIGAGASVGADNMLTAGARLWPGVELPDHALRF